jgi:hypothetical protein
MYYFTEFDEDDSKSLDFLEWTRLALSFTEPEKTLDEIWFELTDQGAEADALEVVDKAALDAWIDS